MIGRARPQKKEERPLMSSKTKMVIFGLCSTSDDRPSDQQKLTEM